MRRTIGIPMFSILIWGIAAQGSAAPAAVAELKFEIAATTPQTDSAAASLRVRDAGSSVPSETYLECALYRRVPSLGSIDGSVAAGWEQLEVRRWRENASGAGFAFDVSLVDGSGRRLPPGEYRLTVGYYMAQLPEMEAWLAERATAAPAAREFTLDTPEAALTALIAEFRGLRAASARLDEMGLGFMQDCREFAAAGEPTAVRWNDMSREGFQDMLQLAGGMQSAAPVAVLLDAHRVSAYAYQRYQYTNYNTVYNILDSQLRQHMSWDAIVADWKTNAETYARSYDAAFCRMLIDGMLARETAFHVLLHARRLPARVSALFPAGSSPEELADALRRTDAMLASAEIPLREFQAVYTPAVCSKLLAELRTLRAAGDEALRNEALYLANIADFLGKLEIADSEDGFSRRLQALFAAIRDLRRLYADAAAAETPAPADPRGVAELSRAIDESCAALLRELSLTTTLTDEQRRKLVGAAIAPPVDAPLREPASGEEAKRESKAGSESK